MTTPPPIAIRALDATEAAARLGELADILVDAVRSGASVNFLADLRHDQARAFWAGQIAAIGAGEKQLLVGDDGHRLLGTAMLALAQQPNQPHRAEIGKMLVLSSVRRQGLARRLLAAAEEAARAAGRTLLILDTETGSAGERLYRGCGWTQFGLVPDYALTPDGRLAPASFFYKTLTPG